MFNIFRIILSEFFHGVVFFLVVPFYIYLTSLIGCFIQKFKQFHDHTRTGTVEVNQFEMKISSSINTAKNENRPAVLLIKKGTFEKYSKEIQKFDDQRMKREETLEIVLENLDDNAIVVSTTGKTSREIFEIREKRGQSHQQDFLTVGSMGHCSSIALGIALAKPHRQVVCIDGD